jgi:hypothetical protein
VEGKGKRKKNLEELGTASSDAAYLNMLGACHASMRIAWACCRLSSVVDVSPDSVPATRPSRRFRVNDDLWLQRSQSTVLAALFCRQNLT